MFFLSGIFFCSGGVFGQDTGTEKVGLLVGISHYPQGTGWDSLHARRDLEAVTTVLQRQGFNDLRILEDGAATKKGVVDAISSMHPPIGASVVLFFSMHGQQLPDDADPDYEPDGQDEALALYGAPSEFPSSYRGEQHLRDDELRGLLDGLRAKVGPRGEVVVLVDACYSGTIDRGPREYWAPIRSSAAVTKNARTRLEGTGIVDSVSVSGSVRANRNGGGGVESGSAAAERVESGSAAAENVAGLGALTVITGSRADEQSREVLTEEKVYMGSLAWAFCKGMEAAGPSATYRGLFEDIQRFMIQGFCASRPQLHGDPDRLLFQGRAVERAQRIAVLEHLGGDTVLVDAGTLGGLSVGSKVGLFQAETRSVLAGGQLAGGVVVEASTFRAKVVWERAVGMDSLRRGWVLVTEKCFGALCPRVQLDCGGAGLCAMAEAQLLESGIVTLVDVHPELVVAGGSGVLVLLSQVGDTLYDSRRERGDSTRLVRMLERRLTKCLVAKCIRTTSFTDRRYQMEPFVALQADSVKLTPRGEFKMGDAFLVGGVHTGTRAAYYNIVYLEDWEASLLAPWDGGALDQLLVQPGARFIVGMPYVFTSERRAYEGVFKVIASEAPLDLRGIVDLAGVERGNDPRDYRPLEWMIRCVLKDKVKRSEGISVDVDLTRAWSGEVGVRID